ncbi:hypothetical protein J2T22_004064 [Pseudarthrobacter defluvii]|uniref:Uncharacterized protein n=1 Tax=Pseudarthrobacter defluvii TaxID=410837 RepID=A0ABT9UR07_9MICC|nr:hypothetical protein [Pseudarthrobacter defluvii]
MTQDPSFDAQASATTAPLEAAGLRSAIHATASGMPYAAFVWRTERLGALNCTAAIYGGAWRLTAHDSTAGGAFGSASIIASRNSALPLVRGVAKSATGEFNSVLSLRLTPSRVTRDNTIDLLVHLSESVAFLRGELDEPPALPRLSPLPAGGTLSTGRQGGPSKGRAGPFEPVIAELMEGWCEVALPSQDVRWASLTAIPGLIDRLHDWTPTGTLVDRGAMVTARVTTLVVEPGLPRWLDAASADAQRLLEAVRGSV